MLLHLALRVEKAESTVNVARELLSKLSGEKQRWSSQVNLMQFQDFACKYA